MSVNATNDNLNELASKFHLKSVNNKFYDLEELVGEKGTIMAFICNHCPYVVRIIERFVIESDNLKKIGVSTIAIMSNDTDAYPEDSFDNMKLFASKYKFNFPYLYDHSQEVAKLYKAVCTPDFYGFNKSKLLKYRGRLDSGVLEKNKKIKRELFYAMKLIANTNNGPAEQYNSFGCSIKWKTNE